MFAELSHSRIFFRLATAEVARILARRSKHRTCFSRKSCGCPFLNHCNDPRRWHRLQWSANCSSGSDRMNDRKPVDDTMPDVQRPLRLVPAVAKLAGDGEAVPDSNIVLLRPARCELEGDDRRRGPSVQHLTCDLLRTPMMRNSGSMVPRTMASSRFTASRVRNAFIADRSDRCAQGGAPSAFSCVSSIIRAGVCHAGTPRAATRSSHKSLCGRSIRWKLTGRGNRGTRLNSTGCPASRTDRPLRQPQSVGPILDLTHMGEGPASPRARSIAVQAARSDVSLLMSTISWAPIPRHRSQSPSRPDFLRRRLEKPRPACHCTSECAVSGSSSAI